MNLSIGRHLIFVTDLDAAVGFYRDVLGMELIGQTPQRVSFGGDGFVLDAFQCEEPGDWESHATRAGSALAFQVGSIDDAVTKLRERGVVFLRDKPSENDLGRYIAFRDPFGVVHELFEPGAG